MNNKPYITIGVPTYKRNDLLLKTLNCLKKQTFRNIKVYVSNNSTDPKDIEKINIIKKEMEKQNFTFNLIHQKKNLGAINNLLFLLSLSKTKYFMWLCDDDEISKNCIEILLKDMENKTDASSIVPYWAHVVKDNDIKLKKPVVYTSKFKIVRIINFLYRSDDAFFYALHKTDNLKKCKYYRFWDINKNIINWAYPYLFQLIIRGKVYLTSNKEAVWYNREYIFKHTLPEQKTQETFFNKINYLFIKKINVHYIYFKHIIESKNFLLIFVYILIFPSFLLIDLIKILKIK